MSTCQQLDLGTLGSRVLIFPKSPQIVELELPRVWAKGEFCSPALTLILSWFGGLV